MEGLQELLFGLAVRALEGQENLPQVPSFTFFGYLVLCANCDVTVH